MATRSRCAPDGLRRRLTVVLQWWNRVDRVGASVLVILVASTCVDAQESVTGRRLAASDTTCLITDTGGVDCFGGRGPWLRDTLPSAAIDVDVAIGHACAVLASGAVACWGRGRDGQLGDSSNVSDRSPHFTDVGDRFIQVSVDSEHSCAVTERGKLWCWGSNQGGQLGHPDLQNIGDDETAASTTAVALTDDVVAVELSFRTTCVVFAGGRARCWGSGGVTPDTTRPPCASEMCEVAGCCDRSLPSEMEDLPLPEPVVALSGESSHMCALSTTGNVYCWGTTGAAFSYATLDRIELPNDLGAVAIGEPALEISAGQNHTCARLEGGRMKCWGASEFGKLGLGEPAAAHGSEIAERAAIDVGGDVLAIAAGEMHTCALVDDGTVRCWGDSRVFDRTLSDRPECYDSMPFPNPMHGDPPTIEEFDCTNDPGCCIGDDEHPSTVPPIFEPMP